MRAGDTLSDALRIGIALRQMEDSPLRQHLLLNGSRLVRWKDFKSEITDVLRAMAAVGPTPMDVSALVKGGKPGGEGAKGSARARARRSLAATVASEGTLPKSAGLWAAARPQPGTARPAATAAKQSART